MMIVIESQRTSGSESDFRVYTHSARGEKWHVDWTSVTDLVVVQNER